MLRAAVAVVVGYLVTAIVVALATIAAFMAMGPDRAFLAGSFNPSAIWLITCFAFSFVAAILGGLVCRAISGPGAVKVLAALILLLGIGLAIPALTQEDTRPAIREPGLPSLQAMTNARQPVWATMAFPFLGAVGALIGGSRKRS
jgi:hypothetical protein